MQLPRKPGYMCVCGVHHMYVQCVYSVQCVQCVVMTLWLWPPLSVTQVQETARRLMLFLLQGELTVTRTIDDTR